MGEWRKYIRGSVGHTTVGKKGKSTVPIRTEVLGLNQQESGIECGYVPQTKAMPPHAGSNPASPTN